MNNMIILTRGIAGAGKSFLVNQILERYPEGVVCSADDFFLKDGIYNFNKDLLGQAHGQCKLNFINYLNKGYNPVVVDNTNIRWDEVKFYIELAAIADYDVFLAEPKTSWSKDAESCYNRNGHGVPLETIQRMIERYQPNSHIIYHAKEAFNIEVKEYVHIEPCENPPPELPCLDCIDSQDKGMGILCKDCFDREFAKSEAEREESSDNI